MNEGLFPQQYGAPFKPYRTRYSYGQGTSRVDGEALVYGVSDTTTSTYSARGGSGAMMYSVCDLVIQVPLSASHKADAYSAVAFGPISTTVPDGTQKGGNRRGAGAVDLQSHRQGAAQVASGDYAALVGGIRNTASAPNSVVVGGKLNIASGQSSIALGEQCTAAAKYSLAIGYLSTSDIQGAVALGQGASSRGTFGSVNFAASYRSRVGDRNLRITSLAATTTNATPTVLTTGGGAVVDAQSYWTLDNNMSAAFTGQVVARNSSTGDTIVWKFEGAVRREASASTVALVAAVTPTVLAASASMTGCALAVGVNTTYGGIELTFTGLAANTIIVNSRIDCVEAG